MRCLPNHKCCKFARCLYICILKEENAIPKIARIIVNH